MVLVYDIGTPQKYSDKIGDTNSQICLEKRMLICMKEYVLDIGPDMFRADKFRLKLET